MDEKMTWHPRWQHFLREFLTRGQASCPASTPWTRNWASGQEILSIKYCIFCANRNAVATLGLLQIQVFQTISPSRSTFLFTNPQFSKVILVSSKICVHS